MNARAWPASLGSSGVRGVRSWRARAADVELPEGERLADLAGGDAFYSGEVSDSTGDAQDAAAGARGEAGARRSELEQLADLRVRRSEALEVGGWHCAVECTLTLDLSCPGARDSQARDGARLPHMMCIE